MVLVHPDLHTVVARVACVASGLIAPGVQDGSGRGCPLVPPIRHVPGPATGACGSSVANAAEVPDELPGEPVSPAAIGWHAMATVDMAASTMTVTNTFRTGMRSLFSSGVWRIVVDAAAPVVVTAGPSPRKALARPGTRNW